MSRTIKKDMSLLMVLMAVLSFVIMPTSAYAASAAYCTEPGTQEPCPSCTKAQVWHIPTTCTAVPQGGSSTNPTFDWDATYGYCEQALPAPATGYLGFPGTESASVVNNKLIMNICCCPDACDFAAGWVIGLEIEILTRGVYWATDANVPALAPGAANCYGGGNDYGAYQMYGLAFSRWNKGTAGTIHAAPCSVSQQPGFANVVVPPATTATRMGYPGGSTTNELDNVDTLKIAYYTASRSVTAQGATTTSPETRAKIIRTPTPYDGYELTAADIQQNLCDFWFDVPAMVAYSSEVTAGATVQIQAKLLVSPPYQGEFSNGGVDPGCDDLGTVDGGSYLRPATDPGRTGTAGTFFENDPPRCQALGAINGAGWTDVNGNGLVDEADTGCKWRWPQTFCPECASPCNCIKDVGIICCTSSVTPVSSCIYFPYVLSGMQDQGWVTGIGLSRICDPATGTNPTVTLQLSDCNGVDYTASPTFTYCLGTSGMTIDGMISDLTWTPAIPADYSGQWVLRVNANFVIDGYQFNLNSSDGGMFGAGVLPRQSCPCQ